MESKLERWESSVREKPGVAEKFGPPNWLVQESWKRKKDGTPAEPFEDAVERVRERYFPKDVLYHGEELSQQNVPATDVPAEMSQVDTKPTLAHVDGSPHRCAGCEKVITYGGLECYACKKRRQRGCAQ